MRRILFALILLPGMLFSIQGGTIGKWKSYTSKKEVRNAAVVNGIIWAATSGGLFAYHMHDSTIEQFTTSNGLHTIDLTALTVDGTGTLWIGASNGLLQAYTPRTGVWEYITGILNAPNEPQKNIHAITSAGDTLFILSDIGVSIFSLSRREFGDTYRRFGTGGTQLSGNAVALVTFQGQFWVATSSGITSTPLTTQNPSEPGSWQVMNAGLPSSTVHGLAVYHDTLFAATASGIVWLNGTSWQLLSQTTGRDFTTLSTQVGEGIVTPPSLFFSTENQLWRYGENFIGAIATGFPSSISSLASHGVVGTTNDGIHLSASPHTTPIGAQWTQVIPPGPHINGLVGMAIDDAGLLWAGTGNTAGKGFMSFDGATWKKYLPETDPQFSSVRYSYIIDIGSDNSKWISTFGEGVVQLDKNDEVIHTFNTTNGLAYTDNSQTNTTFVVVTGVVTESNGDVWINVRSAINRKLLAIYSPSTDSFRYASYPVGSKVPILTNIVMDTYGTKWFTSLSDPKNSSPGLVFYDKTMRLPRRLNSSTGWGVINNNNDGLTDDEITALAVDRDGSLWVGTNQGGLNIIVDPTLPYQILQYHPLQGQRINDILVDPINQKWVATEQGVFLLSPDGTSILDQFTVESTDGKLPDNRVESLTMNRETGTIYFGTEGGLATLTTVAVNPRSSFDGLRIYPNPFLLPASSDLTVDGLVEGSSMKILSTSGTLIKNISTPGGRVGFWNGTDEHGNMVPSGIYIVTAYSKDGSTVGNGKVAVIRK